MLRRIRIAIAAISFVLITLLFLDFTGTFHQWFGWLAKIQLLPAFLALNIGVVAVLVLLTLLLGRVYCSVICPLGVFQDIAARATSLRRKGKRQKRFAFSPAITWLRYGVLAVFAVLFVLGINSVFALLEPYSIYGRIASNLFAPFYQLANNLLGHLAIQFGSYAFSPVEIWLKSGIGLAIAAVFFVLVGVLAWRNGRIYCNSVCPVGTVLGVLARFSLFKPIINTAKCNRCGLCAGNCKSSCINPQTQTIDYSRCVTCMNCVGQCRQNALVYTRALFRSPTIAATNPTASTNSTNSNSSNGSARRNFLSLAVLFSIVSVLRSKFLFADGGLAELAGKQKPDRATSLVPAGSQGLRNFAEHCTACQLCISVCPNQVLRPSHDLSKFLQPEISFERGYCRPECVRCSEICPTAAIQRITTAEKTAVQIGHAVWIKDYCVVTRDAVTCKNCERHCPTGAIQLLPQDSADPQSLKIPAIDAERCIGCGACEHLCPARPRSAIYIEGHERHRMI
ncbi:MAG: 4Fe-4S binding protein [Planctomycetaceae bacterium]|jgi:polyferredoxin|nr:4Fe-4S binding protein [Planctomycetaceae bacterium]